MSTEITNDEGIVNFDMIERVIKSGHTSILEHVSFTFLIEGCSLVARSQLFRHRLMSLTEQSKRSVDANKIGFVIPEGISKDTVQAERYQAAMHRAWDSYNKLLELGASREEARYVLPIAQTTQFVATVNCRELFDVIFPLRMCKRTQIETREVVGGMYQICMSVMPRVFRLTGPKCIVTGTCTEQEKCK
jgi:thymidylate synthase (FAD)